MLQIIQSMGALSLPMLAGVYAQSLAESGRDAFPRLPEGQQLQQAEQDFFAYLRESFFPSGGRYALWEEAGQYVSALRLLPYRDGLLIAGLETAPNARNRGFAAALMQAVQAVLPRPVILYSHVDRGNAASMAVHRRCGFQVISDCARLLDGSVSHKIATLRYMESKPG